MTPKTCHLIGAPIDSGQRRPGCLMGPAAFRVAGIATALRDLGHQVIDRGDVAIGAPAPANCANPAVHSLAETVAWTAALATETEAAMGLGFPIVMGGDHSLGLGCVAGVAAHAKGRRSPAVPAVAGRAFRFSHALDHAVGQPARHARRLYLRARWL